MYLQAEQGFFIQGTFLGSSSEPGKSLQHRIAMMRDDALAGNGMDIITNVLKHHCGYSLVRL